MIDNAFYIKVKKIITKYKYIDSFINDNEKNT